MKSLRIFCALLAGVALTCSAFAQNPATFGSANGRYGLSAWAINNQRVASQYNYDLDSLFGGNAVGGGSFTFPINLCTQALAFGGGRNVNPFSTNASIRIVDITSANSETVNGVAPTYNGSTCTLSVTAVNAHTSFHMRSGTCGLQEAINDMGTSGGEVIVDQKFYDDGCTATTITGINPLVTATSGPVRQNIFVHDISAGQNTWYGLKPTTTSLIAAGVLPVSTTVAGGTFTNGNVIESYTYVDVLGNESLPSAETTQATGGTTNGLVITAPAAATGAVGYRVYFTAVGGSTLTEIAAGTGTGGDPNSTNCTLTTLENIKPACAIGANFTVLAPVTSTSKEPIFGDAHTTFSFQAFNFLPEFPSGSTVGTFQTLYLPFSATTTITSGSAADVASIFVPAGYFNQLGGSWDVCFKAASTNVATAIPTWTLTASTLYGQTIRVLDTVVFTTQTGAVTTDGCFNLTTAVVGASGTFWAGTLGPITEAINSTGVTVAGMDVTTAVSGTLDLTKGVYLNLNLAAGTANITGVTTNIFQLRPVNGN